MKNALSEHFSFSEAYKSHTASRLKIDNKPAAEYRDRLVRVAESILEPVRAHYGVPFALSSWYRCPDLNKAIGSKPTSQHITGRAVDFEIPIVANVDLAHWCSSNLTFDQLILEFYNAEDPAAGWVHCSLPVEGSEPRMEILTISKAGAVHGLPEISDE